MDISQHREWFENYAAAKVASSPLDPEPLLIKLEHTKNVLANVSQIAVAENFNPTLARAVKLAALYHDLSRFDQFIEYGTFKDKDSRNHGAWSVKLLKLERRLEREKTEIQRLVLIAVGMHNRLLVPPAVGGDSLLACNALRDADKLDILRVMDEHLSSGKPYNPTVILGLPDEADRSGPEVIRAALNDRAASYADLRSVNDFRLLLGTWFFCMNFQSSRELYKAAGHGRSLVAALPNNRIYSEAKYRILALLKD